MTRESIRAGFVVAIGTWLVVGCGAPAPVERQTPAQPTVSPQPSVMSPVSINAEMVAIVDHAGHQLWAVEQEGKAPKTDADWANVTEHATQLAAGGALIRVAGTGINDVGWVASPGWQKSARAMSDAAMAALKAAEGKNLNALVAANGQLVDACESCHKEFKPDLPSEGIVHSHAH
jgi:hypothetical protein